MATIIGDNLPGIPWEDRPAGCSDVVWRYSKNPIVERDQIPGSNSIFNSAVVAKTPSTGTSNPSPFPFTGRMTSSAAWPAAMTPGSALLRTGIM